jgi:hypothetical protein
MGNAAIRFGGAERKKRGALTAPHVVFATTCRHAMSVSMWRGLHPIEQHRLYDEAGPK